MNLNFLFLFPSWMFFRFLFFRVGSTFFEMQKYVVLLLLLLLLYKKVNQFCKFHLKFIINVLKSMFCFCFYCFILLFCFCFPNLSVLAVGFSVVILFFFSCRLFFAMVLQSWQHFLSETSNFLFLLLLLLNESKEISSQWEEWGGERWGKREWGERNYWSG